MQLSAICLIATKFLVDGTAEQYLRWEKWVTKRTFSSSFYDKADGDGEDDDKTDDNVDDGECDKDDDWLSNQANCLLLKFGESIKIKILKFLKLVTTHQV